MPHRLPRDFLAGEILDWEAPTGGYLVQVYMATSRAAALRCSVGCGQVNKPLPARRLRVKT